MTCVRMTTAGTCLPPKATVATVVKTGGCLIFLLKVTTTDTTDDIGSKPGDMDDRTTSPQGKSFLFPRAFAVSVLRYGSYSG